MPARYAFLTDWILQAILSNKHPLLKPLKDSFKFNELKRFFGRLHLHSKKIFAKCPFLIYPDVTSIKTENQETSGNAGRWVDHSLVWLYTGPCRLFPTSKESGL